MIMTEDNNNIDENAIVEKNGLVSLKGQVMEILPNSSYNIKLSNGAIVIGHSSGKMKKNRIRVMQFDTVDVEISASDLVNLNKSSPVLVRVMFRYK
jgi:translation initiation factor IF-1